MTQILAHYVAEVILAPGSAPAANGLRTSGIWQDGVPPGGCMKVTQGNNKYIWVLADPYNGAVPDWGTAVTTVTEWTYSQAGLFEGARSFASWYAVSKVSPTAEQYLEDAIYNVITYEVYSGIEQEYYCLISE